MKPDAFPKFRMREDMSVQTFLKKRVVKVIVGWTAGRTCGNHNKYLTSYIIVQFITYICILKKWPWAAYHNLMGRGMDTNALRGTR